jgi:hypothetical protein
MRVLALRLIGGQVGETRADTQVGPAARHVADAFVADLLASRQDQMYARMERRFREDNPQGAFPPYLDAMFAWGGKPLSAEFKAYEDGRKFYLDGTSKPMRKFWYAARTTKSEGGPYFLMVEVVPDEGGPACTAAGLVNFPKTGPPPNLR